MYSVLILVFLFWFATIYPKCMYKRHLFLKFQVLCEEITDIASFVEHPVYSISKMYSVLIPNFLYWFYINFRLINPKCICKRQFFLKLLVLRIRSSVTASFVEHPVYSISKVYCVLILGFFYFDLPLFTQSGSVKVTFL